MRALGIAVEGVQALSVYKLRTFFMMVGTIVGIAALVVIMAIGKGMEKKVMKRINNFGPRAIMLISGGGKDLPPPDMNVTTLTLQDCEAIGENIKNIESITPIAWQMTMSLKYKTNQLWSMVWGVEPVWHESFEWYPVAGEGISGEDVATMARVCLVGKTVKDELFGDENPLGQRIYVNKVGLIVKGVLEEKGTSPGGMDFDNRIILPITTAMRRVMNVDYIGCVRIISKDASFIPEQTRTIRELMNRRHHITPPKENDFRIISPAVIAQLSRGVSKTLMILLIVLASLSVIVGGVVMMNLLVISVVARIKEIGLRRALGASRRDIFMQFLIESISVTLAGMVLGCFAGWGVSTILAATTRLPVILSWQPFTVAVVFSLLIGIFFGVQPARRAARLHPVEALQ